MSTISVPSPRRPAVAGYFYPAQARTLTSDLERMFKDTPSTTLQGTLIGFVAPHAGYVYSGKVAATAYQHIQGQFFDVVAVISPSHRDPFGGVSVYPGDYATPLGVVQVDLPLVETISRSYSFIKKTVLGHRDEHALEVQLPFLQYALESFRLLPLVMGSQDWETCQALGDALGKVCAGRKSLIIASSDLSHYYSQSSARELDQQAMEAVSRYDERGLYEAILSGRCEACGAGPIIATMIAARKLGANRAHILQYQTSGDVSGDYDQVVGYMAAAFTSES